jgi:uncharacterized protein (DUF4415 family)
MISDEPDEDADTLDDENLLDTVLSADAGERDVARKAPDAASGSDWPLSHRREAALGLDAKTLEWFRANHADWREAMDAVLRGWIVAHAREQPDVQPFS